MPFGVSDPDFDPVLGILSSGSRSSTSTDIFRTFDPFKMFFCLNFSSHAPLFTLAWQSELPTVCAKNLALSLIRSSSSGRPCRWWFLAQLDKARSISGNLPFGRFMGDWSPLSIAKNFSFWRRTLDTVLAQFSLEGLYPDVWMLYTCALHQTLLSTMSVKMNETRVRQRRTSNFGLLDIGVFLMIFTHSPSVTVCKSLPGIRRRSLRC